MSSTSVGSELDSPATNPATGSQQWPGERHPTGWDVHDANESPPSTFLERFKANLLASEDARDCRLPANLDVLQEPALDTQFSSDLDLLSTGKRYTYPIVLLSEIPPIPPEEEIEQLQAAFSASFKRHIYLDAIDTPESSFSTLPPYLQFAFACLASVASRPQVLERYVVGKLGADISAVLFVAGVNMWSVILEIDNREARLLDAVVASALLLTYGTLSTIIDGRRKASSLLHNTATIARRLRLLESHAQSERNESTKSSLMSYMLLHDVTHALHCGTTPVYSTAELFIKMPSSNNHFRTVYPTLLHGYHTLPKNMTAREDALLLLIALLNDIIYIQHSFLTSVNTTAGAQNPYIPLSSRSEHSRLVSTMESALARWEQHFYHSAGKDVLGLYHFSKLFLSCPDIWELTRLAGYRTENEASVNAGAENLGPHISDKTMDLAWLVLDNCDVQAELPERKYSIWLPVVLFLSALVIWQRLRFRSPHDFKYGTLKVLSMYKNELIQLPWPCSLEMAETLDRLLKQSSS